MGLRVKILKDQYGDTSNGGASSRVGRLTITNVEGPFEPDATAPAAILKHGVMGTIIVVLENPSMDKDNEDLLRRYVVGPMFGGSFITTSDSRFSEKLRDMGLYSHVAIPFHDRYETAEVARILSI